MTDERARAIELAIRALEKAKKVQNLVVRGDSQTVVQVECIPSGSLGLDIALGVGGFPRGRIVEIIGENSVGKTTLALQAIANAQTEGLKALFIDAEQSFDPAYAQNLGVNLGDLYICQPDDGSQGMDVLYNLIKTGAFGIAVVDSVSAMIPESVASGDPSAITVGAQARLMSQAMPMLSPWARKTKTCLIFLNQIRYKIGQMFGNPETTSGGNALMHYASVRVQLRRQLSREIKDGDERIGNQVTATVTKNKLYMPFKRAEFDILYGRGVDRLGELVTLGLRYQIISQAGAWYSWKGERIGQGRDNARQYLADHPQAAQEIEQAIRQAAFGARELVEPIQEEEINPQILEAEAALL